MKKLIYIFSIALILDLMGCTDQLNTNPTDKVSGPTIFSTAENAKTALNGIYRAMYTDEWGTKWGHENGGIMAYILVEDLMADDHLMDAVGSGWFYSDYNLDVWGDYTGTYGHPYQVWHFFYTIISNANYIIAEQETLKGGSKEDVNYIMGQAYALRAWAYMWLVQYYSQPGPDYPGVPIYTEPTTASSVGKGRGKVQDVYNQANADIDIAISLLGQTYSQQVISHIDLNVAYGIKARMALVQKDYATALAAAQSALKGKSLGTFDEVKVVNSTTKPNVMWGLEIITSQALNYSNFFYHMDSDAPESYGSTARQCIDAWLYNQIPSTDSRKQWFRGDLPKDEELPSCSMGDYVQLKFQCINSVDKTGDYILMRTEEMQLIAAEAACHLKQFSTARSLIFQLGSLRDSDYATRLSKFTDSDVYQTNTKAPLTTLMDEILFQRRLELWGENPRIQDLQRLGLGYHRDYAGSNHTATVVNKNTNANSPYFILSIPQAEIDGNEVLTSADQNPEP